MLCSNCKKEIKKAPFYQLWYRPKTIFCCKDCMYDWFDRKNIDDFYIKILGLTIFKRKK